MLSHRTSVRAYECAYVWWYNVFSASMYEYECFHAVYMYFLFAYMHTQRSVFTRLTCAVLPFERWTIRKCMLWHVNMRQCVCVHQVFYLTNERICRCVLFAFFHFEVYRPYTKLSCSAQKHQTSNRTMFIFLTHRIQLQTSMWADWVVRYVGYFFRIISTEMSFYGFLNFLHSFTSSIYRVSDDKNRCTVNWAEGEIF